MNSLFIHRLSEYKHNYKCGKTIKNIIYLKIINQNNLLKKYSKKECEVSRKNLSKNVLITEARVAKNFWQEFRKVIPEYKDFNIRKPHKKDVVNTLLDIGYHFLSQEISKILDKYDMPYQLGILHVPHSKDAKPLVYDLMEMFRSDVVDSELLKYLNLKKKKLNKVSNKEISHFVHRIKNKMNKKYYIKSFKKCHTYRYYMELQVLLFISSVNHKKVFKPIHLPRRHENRCT